MAGLGAAWLLGSRHDVVLFEAEDRLGGHANTVDIATPGGPTAVDTGFIVYNTGCYPNLIALFDRLGVETAPTTMGFSVSLGGGAYEYCGSGLAGLIGGAPNLASADHWRLMRDLFRFFKDARAAGTIDTGETLGAWLTARNYSKSFIHGHIVPMAAAIWSAPADEMLAFPFASFARFFDNHGLLQVRDRPAWRTVRGGSRNYVRRLTESFNGRMVRGDPVVAITGAAARAASAASPAGAFLRTRSGAEQSFDAVLLACHADDALRLVGGRDAETDRLLSAFRYQSNSAVLHTDQRHMPRRRRLWSSWNYLGDARERSGGGTDHVSVTYWMNALQPLSTASDVFVTLNPQTEIDTGLVKGRFSYDHPLFDGRALAAQPALWQIQGRNNL
ncbi:MAG: NAD(P)/FAD-dependent oxidoreductase, partial [Hyphomicrobium sp.]